MRSLFSVIAVLLFAGLIAVGASSSGRSPKTLPNGVDFTDDGEVFMRMVRAEEKRVAISYRNQNGAVQNSNKHVLALAFRALGDNEVSTAGGLTGGLPGSTTTTGSTTTGGTTATQGGPEMLMEGGSPPTTSSTTGSSGGTTGSTGGGNGTESWTRYYFWVANPNEIAPIGSRVPIVVTNDLVNAGVPAGIGIEFFPGEEVNVHLASDGILPGGGLMVTIETVIYTYVPDDPNTGQNEESWSLVSSFQKVHYQVNKYVCQDASIDTRKAYGTPNREGELADDPNADPTEVNFSNWVWKGGTFVGNMPWTTRDQSGKARLQLYPQGTSGRTYPIRLAAVTAFHNGAPSSATSSLTVGAYTMADADPNIATPSTSVVWPTRWGINPSTSPSSPRDPTKDPMFRVPFVANTPVGEYATWTLTDTRALTSSTPANVLKGVALAIENESEIAVAAWRYFVSQEYQTELGTTFPLNDAAPRLWVVDYISKDEWTHLWGQYP